MACLAGGARGVVGHAGTRLLTDLADKTGLTSGFVHALGLDRVRLPVHEPGRVAVDLAVLLADGGEAISDLAVLRQQPGLFGRVASDPTAWRVLDATGEALAGMLRPGNTAADHITVLDQALHQIPEAHRYGNPILIRSDSAGSSHEFLAHIRSLRAHGLHTHFSVGVAIIQPIRAAVLAAAEWVAALDGDGSLRDGAELAELTDYLDPGVLAAFPAGWRTRSATAR